MPTPHSRKVVVASVKKVVIVGGTRTVTTPKEISTGEILFIGAHTVCCRGSVRFGSEPLLAEPRTEPQVRFA
ncbi:hypothetical protein FRC02_002736 [Tulasnella sp. 418]|nr:hypothetical protein FRC02_002736 [Tulasnella sp. 418]